MHSLHTGLSAALLVLAAPLAAPLAAAPLSPAETAQVDSAVTTILAASKVPSASIAIVRDGAIVYARAYGRQRGDDAPPTPAARYPIASISKQFTAAALLLLAEDGRVSLDDPVGKYLPGLTDANRISLRQLLGHVSGYRDYWPQDYAFAAMAKPVTPQAILDRWAKAPLDFAPGTRWQYSNTGYVAAGLVVEKVSGQPLLAFLRSRIFTPLQMAPVDLDTGLTAADPIGYNRFALGPVRAATPSAPGWLFAAGELAMTASDLARWDIARIDRTILTARAWQAQQTEGKLASGQGTHYGLGVEVDTVAGHRRVFHDGEAVGFLSANRVYPDDRAAVVVLVNADFGNAQDAIADRIEALLLPATDSSARARTLYDQLRHGTLDPALLTVNGRGYFTATVRGDYQASLAALGSPSGFVRTGAQLRGGFTAERYTISFPDRKLTAILRAEPGPDGKVEQFTISPQQ